MLCGLPCSFGATHRRGSRYVAAVAAEFPAPSGLHRASMNARRRCHLDSAAEPPRGKAKPPPPGGSPLFGGSAISNDREALLHDRREQTMRAPPPGGSPPFFGGSAISSEREALLHDRCEPGYAAPPFWDRPRSRRQRPHPSSNVGSSRGEGF
jgi:hypothetical protein